MRKPFGCQQVPRGEKGKDICERMGRKRDQKKNERTQRKPLGFLGAGKQREEKKGKTLLKLKKGKTGREADKQDGIPGIGRPKSTKRKTPRR